MRQLCRDFFLAISGSVLICAATSALLAGDQLGVSEIRLTAAEASSEVPADAGSTLSITTDEPSLPSSPAASPDTRPVADSKPASRPMPTLPYRRANSWATTVTRAQAEPQVTTNQIRQALAFYGGNPARATLSQFPRRSPIQAGPAQPMQQQVKPFHTVYRDPTISPYLNLYREENDTEGAPNYFAFVRPQLEQIEANRAQQGEIQRLERQVQSRSRGFTAPPYQRTGIPTSAGAARYMDTAQFYGGWAR